MWVVDCSLLTASWNPLCPSTEFTNSQIYLSRAGGGGRWRGQRRWGLTGWEEQEEQSLCVSIRRLLRADKQSLQERTQPSGDRLLLRTIRSVKQPLWAWLSERMALPLPWANGLAFVYPQIGGQSSSFISWSPGNDQWPCTWVTFLMIWKTTRSPRCFCAVSHSAT